jgi:hypothetical protein
MKKTHISGGERGPHIGLRHALAEIDPQFKRALRFQ